MSSAASKKREYVRRRSRARRLAMQALYQWFLNPLDERQLHEQYTEKREYEDADADYFATLLSEALQDNEVNEQLIAQHADRPADQIDPLEKAILAVALSEFRHHLEVPYKVVINEAIELAQRFGATDGHKYVNAILDKVAGELRQTERSATR